jgi:hypothetical protein
MIVWRLVRSATPLALVFWVSLVAGRAATAGQDATPELTQHEIIPILRLRCTVCHGHRTKEAGLDLRSKASMLRGGKSGPAIVLGKPAESLTIQKIRSGEMPPNKRLIEVGVKPMSSSELGKFERWIELGAPIVNSGRFSRRSVPYRLHPLPWVRKKRNTCGGPVIPSTPLSCASSTKTDWPSRRRPTA